MGRTDKNSLNFALVLEVFSHTFLLTLFVLDKHHFDANEKKEGKMVS